MGRYSFVFFILIETCSIAAEAHSYRGIPAQFPYVIMICNYGQVQEENQMHHIQALCYNRGHRAMAGTCFD
jgi:hypothetical protein